MPAIAAACLLACAEADDTEPSAPAVPESEGHPMPEAQVPISAAEERGPIAEGWFDRAAVEARFASVDGLRTSPVIELPAPASRASVWLTVEDGAVVPKVWVQAGWANGQTGPWLVLPLVWSEGDQLVLAAGLDTAATSLRLRLDAASAAAAHRLWWTATTPLTADARSAALPDPAVAAGSPVMPRADWGAAAARCGTTDTTADRVVLYRVPGPRPGASAQAFLRALQAFDQRGRHWCDVRQSYLIGDSATWMGRGSRRAAIGDGGDAGRVAVAVLGCEVSSGAADQVTTLLDTLTERLGLATEAQIEVGPSPLCAGDEWLADTRTAWLATDPFGTQPPPPPVEGAVRGTVRSAADRAAIAGAQVSCDCGAVTMTDAAGAFDFVLPVGAHSLSISKTDFVSATLVVDVVGGGAVALAVELDPVAQPAPGISVIDHAFLIEHFGGTDVDPSGFAETQDGFQVYLDAVGVTYFAAWEYVVPNNVAVAEDCGFTILLPERAWWRKAAALGLLADQLRGLVNEPVTLRNWWRPPCYNAAVGGAANGDHPDGDALDLDFRSARSRADAQRYLCDTYWRRDIVEAQDIAPGSNLNPRLNMSVGLGGVTIHLGLLSRNGRRYWKYSSYSTQSNSGNCW